MLEITIPDREFYDEEHNQFFTIEGQTLRLEHSLVSLSKWESKWCKPFITKEKKTIPETIDYIKCMTLTQNVNPEVYSLITDDIIDQVNEYIEAPMTATTFSNIEKRSTNREQITSEIIYYWMIALGIPFECKKWHLNKLLAQIKVCEIKNQPPKKMSRSEIMRRNAAINESRRKQWNTKG